MINFDFTTKCYSCGACQVVCPKKAVTLSENCLPKIDAKCVDCGLCEKVCPYLNEKKYKPYIAGCGYVGRNKNFGIRKKSSSGGIFQLLAESALERGWLVCGCVYDEGMMPMHIVSDKADDVYRMLGSKYVKSELSGALTQIKVLLKKGKTVLFSGTPCQIGAVRNLFPNNPNIICIGVVCHGSIERDVWKAYLKEESKRGKIVDVTMRDKSKGWLNYGLRFKFADNSEHVTYRKEDGFFLKAFTDGLLERKRCLDCAYKGSQIKADILLGDAWGMDSIVPELSDEWGLSGIVCITEIGNDFFQSIIHKIDFSHVETSTLVERNPRMISPAKRNLRCNSFRRNFEKKPNEIHELCERYEKNTIMNRFLSKIGNLIR